jgi:hypothetical protein
LGSRALGSWGRVSVSGFRPIWAKRSRSNTALSPPSLSPSLSQPPLSPPSPRYHPLPPSHRPPRDLLPLTLPLPSLPPPSPSPSLPLSLPLPLPPPPPQGARVSGLRSLASQGLSGARAICPHLHGGLSLSLSLPLPSPPLSPSPLPPSPPLPFSLR